MAAVRAVKSGNWSDPTVWNTGTVPTSGDTVYTNTFTVTIDQDVLIGDTNNYNVNAGSFIIGQWYEVVDIGTTNFGSIGGENTVGSIFLAIGSGTGTGVAKTYATLSNDSNTTVGATAGGSFSVASSKIIRAQIANGRVSNTTLLQIGSGNYNVEIKGRIFGTTTCCFTGNRGVSNSSTGTLTIIGDIIPHSSGIGNVPSTFSSGVVHQSTGNITIVGNIYSGGGGAGLQLEANSAGNINITGNIFCRSLNTGMGIRTSSPFNGIVTIVGSLFDGHNGANAISGGSSTNANGTFYITGDIDGRGAGNFTTSFTVICPNALYMVGNIYTSSFISAFYNPVFTNKFYFRGSVFDANNGRKAIWSRHLQNWNTPPQKAVRQMAVNGSTTMVTYFTVDNDVWDYPAVQNVRDGVSYANNNLIGNCKIPSPSNVTYNVPVDGTVGTAVLKPENVWDYLKNNIDTEGSIGERLKNAVTANDMGKLVIDTLT